MESFPEEFLRTIARQYDLSEKQEDAFVALFSSNRSQEEAAKSLHISHSAFRTRMTGVYQNSALVEKCQINHVNCMICY